MQPKIYTLHKTVSAEHIDDNEHVNNLVYLRWAQEISGKHWQSETQEIDLTKVMWVVARQEVDYLKELMQGDEIRLETHIAEVVKHKCIRKIEFFREDVLVAKAQIIWVLLNRESKKPLRVPQELFSMFF